MTGLPVVVVGDTLAGMAAAARLAKNRHQVIMIGADRPGGRFATRVEHGVEVDDLPGMISFPAPWRDLFRKSGRPFETELARAGLELVPAPPVTHRFPDGTELVLGTDRGDQLAQITTAYGRPAAIAWRDLVDRLDDVWQALRPLGSEYELVDHEQIERSGLHRLVPPQQTVEQLARTVAEPHLAMIIRETAWRLGSDPRRTPAWCAVQLSVERTFGRWVMHHDGRPTRTGTLVDALADRLALRGVEGRVDDVTRVERSADGTHVVHTPTTTISAAAVVMAVDPWTAGRLTGDRTLTRGLRPARAPMVTHRLVSRAGPDPSETRRHTRSGPVITWTRPVGEQTMISTHDHPAGRPDATAGITWRGERAWLRWPSIRTTVPRRYLVGPHSRGGAGLSATILSGALASYAAHDDLTPPASAT